jgi:hypothetical protein
MHSHLVDVLALMEQSHAAVKAAVDAVPAAVRGQRPAPDRWSVADNLEHLALVEARFAASVREAVAKARAAGAGGDDAPRVPLAEAVRTRISDRSERREAPPGATPTGKLHAAAAWAAFEAARNDFRDAVASGDGLALGIVTADHRRWGPLTVYQWVEVLAGHEQRHAAQIAELAEIAWNSDGSGPAARA